MSRATLKRTEADDLPFLKQLWNDGRVMKWVGFPNGTGATDEGISEWLQRRSSHPHFRHYIVLDDNGQRCGEVCFGAPFVNGGSGLDIKLLPEFQGKGLATQALMAVIDAAFQHDPECQVVWTEPSETNAAARRLYARCGLMETERPSDMEQGRPFWALERARWVTLRDAAE